MTFNFKSLFRRAAAPASPSGPSVVTPQRLAAFYLSRHNPVRDLTPENLVQALDAYYRGELRRLALIMDRIEDTDDVLKVVAGKAKKQPGTRGWEIIAEDKSPEAAAHKEALENFYNRLTVTSAIDLDQRGEINLLLFQMMDAKAKGYALHEILWDPQPGYLTAELRFVPLWFFERRTGRLRFLADDHAYDGDDLEPGRWLITHGDGLMRTCAIAKLYKDMPLKDWVIYTGRHGMPGIIGKTHAQFDSPEWRAMDAAVLNFSAEFAATMSANDEITTIDATAKGELPHPKLVERMDRAMASIWRGADLSTISAGEGEGTGASLQGDEAEILAAADSENLADTLRRAIDRVVIKWCCGADVPKAYFALSGVTKDTTEQDLKVDDQLHRMGFPISIESLAGRYGRTIPDADETLLPPPAAPAPLPYQANSKGEISFAALSAAANASGHAAYLQASSERLAAAVQAETEPLARELGDILMLAEAEDWPADRLAERLRALRADLPAIQQRMGLSAEATAAYADIIGTAIINAADDTLIAAAGTTREK
jgi:phage gp29-like protein